MLYKRKNSAYWWIRFRDQNGHEIRQSTGTTDRADAEAYEAKVRVENWRQIRMGDRPQRTWREARDRWIEETSHKKSHQGDLYNLRWLDKHLKDRLLDRISADTINKLFKARKREAVAAATVNRTMAVLRAVLKRATGQWEWLDRSPAVMMLPEPKRRVRWLTREEAERLLRELPDHLEAMARFSLATGLRESNVTRLRWDQIDLTRRVAWVHSDEMKTGRGLAIPLNADAVAVIKRQVGKHQTNVFTFNGNPVARAGGHAWRNALQRAGVQDFRWHDLRHTWASWHVQAGTPLHVLQELGGWQNYEMVKRYAHLSADQLAGHTRNIEGIVGSRTFPGTQPDGAAKTTP